MNVNPDSGESLFDAALDVISNVDDAVVLGDWINLKVPVEAWERLSKSTCHIITENIPTQARN